VADKVPVLEFGCQLDSLACTYITDHMYTELQIALGLPGHDYCVSPGAGRTKLPLPFTYYMKTDQSHPAIP
jgi:hypothetical protein